MRWFKVELNARGLKGAIESGRRILAFGRWPSAEARKQMLVARLYVYCKGKEIID